VAYGVDVDTAIKTAFGEGLVQRERCPISRGVFGNNQDFCAQHGYDYNPDKARALLAELGYSPSKPLEVTLMTSTGDNREKMVQIFQGQLAEVGIKANLETMDIGSLNARVKQENERKTGVSTFDLMDWAWFDPDILHQLWHSPGAYSGYQSPELDALLDKTRTTVDPVARQKAVNAAMAYLLEKAVHVPLYTPDPSGCMLPGGRWRAIKLAPLTAPSSMT
jgi:peptide/nickel transport system substrate-binding protein